MSAVAAHVILSIRPRHPHGLTTSLRGPAGATVKTHVHNAFAKLGINARAQLAQHMRGSD
jgi:hypothetical protein